MRNIGFCDFQTLILDNMLLYQLPKIHGKFWPQEHPSWQRDHCAMICLSSWRWDSISMTPILFLSQASIQNVLKAGVFLPLAGYDKHGRWVYLVRWSFYQIRSKYCPSGDLFTRLGQNTALSTCFPFQVWSHSAQLDEGGRPLQSCPDASWPCPRR